MSIRTAIDLCRSGLVREHYFYFKLMSPTAGVALAAAALTAGIRPNVLTVAGFTLAIPIVALNLSGQLLWACLGLHVFYAIDCADGILARASKQTSRAGAFLDDLAHSIVPPAYFLSLAFWAMFQGMDRLAMAAATFACAELAYRNVIQSMKTLPAAPSAEPPESDRVDPRAWLISSFHLPTVAVFVTAAVLWPDILTGYLAYATLGTLLYFSYAAFRMSTRMGQSA